jgi:hypothetical protein
MAEVLASVVNLDRPGHFIHWWVVQISVANLLVVASMVLVFVLALVVPFPKSDGREPVDGQRS